MSNILIVGCGLIGSSILRAVNNKKIFKNIFILEKSKKNISIIKKLKIKCKIVNNIKNISTNIDLVILCTPMSQYSKIISKDLRSLSACKSLNKKVKKYITLQ